MPTQDTLQNQFLDYFRTGQRVTRKRGKDTALSLLEEEFTKKGFGDSISKALAEDVLAGRTEAFFKLFEPQDSPENERENPGLPGDFKRRMKKKYETRKKLKKKGCGCGCDGAGDCEPNEPINKLRVFKSDDDFVIYGPSSVAIVDKENDLITGEALRAALPQLLKRGRLSLQHLDILPGEILEKWEAPNGEVYKTEVRPVTEEDIQRFELLKKAGVEPGTEALFLVGRIYKDEIGQEVIEEILKGRLGAFSISGQALETETSTDCTGFTCKLVNTIKSIAASAVTICETGMNQAAGFQVINKADNVWVKNADDHVFKFVTDDKGRISLERVTKDDLQVTNTVPGEVPEGPDDKRKDEDLEGEDLEDLEGGEGEPGGEPAMPMEPEPEEDDEPEHTGPFAEGAGDQVYKDLNKRLDSLMGVKTWAQKMSDRLDAVLKDEWRYDGMTESGRARWRQVAGDRIQYTDSPDNPPGGGTDTYTEEEHFSSHPEEGASLGVEPYATDESAREAAELLDDWVHSRDAPPTKDEAREYLQEQGFNATDDLMERIPDYAGFRFSKSAQAEANLNTQQQIQELIDYCREMKNSIPEHEIQALKDTIKFLENISELYAELTTEHPAHSDMEKSLDNLLKGLGEEVMNQPVSYGGRSKDNPGEFQGLPLGYPQKPTGADSAKLRESDESAMKPHMGSEEDYNYPAGSDRMEGAATDDEQEGERPSGFAMKIEKQLDAILEGVEVTQ